jgi:CubicO group peptidase (beta-lactamase class C family)
VNDFRRLVFCGLAFLIAGSLPTSAQSHRRAVPTEAIDVIFKRFDSSETPGCSVAVIDAGKVAFKKSYGMADPALGVPMTSTTTSWIPYSEARVFVALAVGMLAKEGKISLDDPVRRHVPQVPEYASSVTVRHLLHHTSGLADYGILAGPGFELHDRLADDEFFRMLMRWGTLSFAPGQGRTYSNTDYALLKILVERLSDGSLHDYLNAKVLKPAGMSSTRVGFDQAQVVPGHALFHESGEAGFRKLLRYRVSPVGGISVTTNLDDIIRFDHALRDPAFGWGAILTDLEKGALPTDSGAATEEFAFGLYRRTDKGLSRVEYHGVGEFTYLVQVPAADLSVAALCNVYSGMDAFAAQVASIYALPSPAKNSPQINSPQIVSSSPTGKNGAVVTVSQAELQSYVGEYRDEPGGVSIDVEIVDGTLTITPPGGSSSPELKAIGDGKFATTMGGTPYVLQFQSTDGVMGLTSWDVATNEPGGAPLRRITATWEPSLSELNDYPGVYTGDKVELTLHVRLDGERLLIATAGLAESPLRLESEPDRFRLPYIYKAQFERDATGRVVAVVLDASRIQGIRFTKSS